MEQYGMDDSYICLHEGEQNEEYYGAVTPPIVQTSLFTFKDYDTFMDHLKNDTMNYVYTRGVNPTVKILEEKLAKLERGEACKCFSSGMGAISSTLFTLLKAGDHVLFINSIYGPATNYLKELEKFQVTATFVAVNGDEECIEDAIRENTKIIYLESPSTMKFDILDLRKVIAIAKKKGVLTVMDNTCCTPIYQKPLTLGVDLVVHSCSKFMGGHSDIVAGAVIGKKVYIDKIMEIGHQLGGASLGPFDAWLIIRGLRTLPQRLAYQKESVYKVVEMLKQHPRVKRINHPLTFSGRQKEVYESQTTGYTSLFSIEIECRDEEHLRRFMNSFTLFQRGISWGGHESLVFNSITNNPVTKDKLLGQIIRLYIGLEDAAALCNDLKKALDTR